MLGVDLEPAARVLVHGWDLAAATGQPYDADDSSLYPLQGILATSSGPDQRAAREAVRTGDRRAGGRLAARSGHRADGPRSGLGGLIGRRLTTC